VVLMRLYHWAMLAVNALGAVAAVYLMVAR
jgi:hypothetical protein